MRFPKSRPLDPLYINQRRVAALVGADNLVGALSRVSALSEKETAHIRSVKCAELLGAWLAQADDVAPLHAACLTDRLRSGLIFTYEGHLTFRNARGERSGVSSIAHVALNQLGAGYADVRLQFLLHPDHVVVGSPGDLLQGKVGDLFVLGQVHAVDGNTVEAVPTFIGYLQRQGVFEMLLPATRNELHVDSIDNFSKIRDVRNPSTAALERLRHISEAQIKSAFAEILDEPDVPKDWGGERSDLCTTQVRVRDTRLSTAFLFKGPAGGKRFREMRVADLGENGDQIERLVTEPAELLIVQHCHKIGSAVRNTVRAFCNQIGRERHYCLIPGHDTYRILRAYGKCGIQ